MEYILLQPLQTNNPDRLNLSLIERKSSITKEEENLIIHQGGGPFSGFIVKKILPLNKQNALNLDKCDLSFKLSVYMKDSSLAQMQQVKIR